MNKKGQVFIMAAVIIAGIILSAAKIANSARTGSNQAAFYDLADEIDFETKKVIDYGVINAQNQIGLDRFVIDFLGNYSDYIQNEEVVFIFGDSSGTMTAINYQSALTPHVINLATGPNPITLPITLTQATTAQLERDATNSKIKVTIRGIDYTFSLTQGQNFYFVLIKDTEGEKFVATK